MALKISLLLIAVEELQFLESLAYSAKPQILRHKGKIDNMLTLHSSLYDQIVYTEIGVLQAWIDIYQCISRFFGYDKTLLNFHYWTRCISSTNAVM